MTEKDENPISEGKFNPNKWGRLPDQKPVAPADAERRIRQRSVPSDVIDSDTPTLRDEDLRTLSLTGGGNPLGVRSIPEQARALRYNVDLIYEYVHDNVEFIPNYGLHKGGLGALIDGSANAFDQCDLMIQMLKQADLQPNPPGYDPEFVIGTVTLSSAQWSNWLDVDSNSRAIALLILANGGIGCSESADNGITLNHCWVKVRIGTGDYYFDPALKTYTDENGINLAQAMVYDRDSDPNTSFLARAKAGATISAGYSVQNINAGNINSDLTAFSMNLVSWIKQNNPGASIDHILGGRAIVPTAAPVRNLNSLPYPNAVTLEDSIVPNIYKATLRIQYDLIPLSDPPAFNIDVTFSTDLLFGRRLTLFFDASGIAKLRLEGTQYGGNSAAKAAGSAERIYFTVDHPYAENFADEVGSSLIWARGQHFIGTAFGASSKHIANIHQEIQNEAVAAGFAPSSEELLGTSLNLIWDNFLGQMSNGANMLARMGNDTIILHHLIGTVAQMNKPGTTTKIKSVSSFIARYHITNRIAGSSALPTAFALSMLIQSLEGTASEQVTGTVAGDAIRIISICNQGGVIVYDAKSSNWDTGTSPVRTVLSNGGFNNSVLDEIADIYFSQNPPWRVIVPNDPTVQIGAFSDFYGYVGLSPDRATTSSQTWFGAKGAASAVGQDDSQTASAASNNERQVNGFSVPSITASEAARIDMLTGRYELSSTDLTVGNQGMPYELPFVRYYNSSMRLGFQGMGFGWGHNWQMKATVNSEGFIAFGDQQVSAAASTIAALYIIRDVSKASDDLDVDMPVEDFVIECEISRFMVNQLFNNVVHLQMGSSFAMFTKMPDGSYLPARGMHGKSKLEKVTTMQVYFEYTTSDGIKYKFRSDGAIESIIFPFGITILFWYDSSGKLIGVNNGFRFLTFTYDTYGQLKTIYSDQNRVVTLTIDLNTGNLTSVKDPLNHSTVYEYDQRGRMTKVFNPANPTTPVITNVYDSLSRVKEQLDAYGNVWQYFIAGTRAEELAPNNTNRVVYFNGSGSAVRSINALSETVVTEYDGNERSVLTTFPEGNSVATTYDADGNVVTQTQHAKPGSGLADRSTTTTYETTWNKLATLTDPAGETFSYEYNSVGTNGASLCKKITAPAVAAGTAITELVYNSKGQLTRTTDPTGLVTEYTYEPANFTNNLLSIAIDPSQLNIVSSFTYDNVGNVYTITSPMGEVTTILYDALRRETQITGTAPFSQTSYATYDPNGNLTEIQTLASTDVNTQKTQMTYGVDNQLLTVVGPVNYPDGTQSIPTRFEYDELRRLKNVIDASGRVVSTNYDALGRPENVSVNGVIEESTTYTTNGLQQSVTDARNKTTGFEYDGFDRGIKATYPDSLYESLVYDSRDNILQARTRSGLVFDFTYDDLGQRVSRSLSGYPTVSFSYDLAGRPSGVSVPTISGDPSTGTFTLLYDSAKRPNGEQYPDGKIVALTLDKNGRPTAITYPDLTQVTQTFDDLDRLTSISGFGGDVVYEYDSASRRIGQISGNKIGQGYSFDKVSNLIAMTVGNLKPSQFTTGTRIDYSYKYSEIATRISRQANESSFNWEPTTSKTITYSTADDMNRYLSVDGATFTYNTTGCLTDDGVNSFGYDVQNNLTSIVTPTANVQLKYDPLGRLTQKIVGSTSMRYVYEGLRRIEEYDDAGVLTRRYVYGNGLDECLFVVDVPSGVITYLHHDELGSTTLCTDITGTPIGKNVYTPSGELATGSLSNIGIGFTGQFYDADIGLYFFKSRHYSPELGRFLQPDPIGYVAGLNLYSYCDNDPVNNVDPLGLDSTDTQVDFSIGASKSEVYDPEGAMGGLLGTNSANVSSLNSGTSHGGGFNLAQVHAGNIQKTNAAIAALHEAYDNARLAAAAAAQAAAMLKFAAVKAHVDEYMNQGGEVLRSFSFGYGPSKSFLVNLEETIDFSKPVNILAAGYGGAAYGLTEMYGASKAGLFGGKVIRSRKTGQRIVSGIYKGRGTLAHGLRTEFSHGASREWLAAHFHGDIANVLNGNVVNKYFHALTDPGAYQFMPHYWKLAHAPWGPFASTIARIPQFYYGLALGQARLYVAKSQGK